jgi:hypothetical protein
MYAQTYFVSIEMDRAFTLGVGKSDSGSVRLSSGSKKWTLQVKCKNKRWKHAWFTKTLLSLAHRNNSQWSGNGLNGLFFFKVADRLDIFAIANPLRELTRTRDDMISIVC